MVNLELCPFSWIKVNKPAGCFSIFGAKDKIVSEPQLCMESNCQFWQSNGRGCALVKPKVAVSAVNQPPKLSAVALPNNELSQLLALEMAEAEIEPVEHASDPEPVKHTPQALQSISSPSSVSHQDSQSSEERGKEYEQESQASTSTLIASVPAPADKSNSKTIAIVVVVAIAIAALGSGAYFLNMKNKQEVAELQSKLDDEQRIKQEEMKLKIEAQAKAVALEQQKKAQLQEMAQQQEMAKQQAVQPEGGNKKPKSVDGDAAMLGRAHKSLDDLLKQ